jgi:hypothetical protein
MHRLGIGQHAVEIEENSVRAGHDSSEFERNTRRCGITESGTQIMATEEELKAELERLRKENEALKRPTRGQISMRVSEKGGLSVYGLGRFPVTLYREQWEKLIAMAEEITKFIQDNDALLKKKE